MHPMEPAALAGDLVVIEPLRLEHAAGLSAAADADEVFAWLPFSRPTSAEEARAWIEGALVDRVKDRRLPFAVRAVDGGAIIGSASYWDFDADNLHAEISTWLSRSSWRTGRNTEAKVLLMDHAFDTLGLERVAFRTDALNDRARRAIERLGATREGVHRHEKRRPDGSWRDTVYYSILRSEWPAARTQLTDSLRAHH
jgi:RimJ/RimL family protein N-acetyltransferase